MPELFKTPANLLAQDQRNATVLLVDGNQGLLISLVDLLRQGGFRFVHCRQDLQDLPQYCRDLSPDVLVLNQPGDSPAAVATLMAALGTLAQLAAGERPTLLLRTGVLDAAAREEARRRGVSDFIAHNCDPMEVVTRVAGAAHRQFLSRQVAQQQRQVDIQVKDRTARLLESLETMQERERTLLAALEQTRTEIRQKTEFLAHATHELRTPLNAILGFADLLRREFHGPLGDARYLEYVEDVHAAASHMAAVVDDTLDLSRAESGQVTLDIRDIDIGRAVQDSTRMLRTLAADCGVDLTVKVPEQPLRLRTDPEKVRQIILNLGSNALKFTPRGGRVTVEVQADDKGGALILIVRDTGVGMAPHELPIALKPFGQVRGAQQPGVRGTGLGLPLTKRFVEMLGGSLDIASVPGRGTIVTVRLPAPENEAGNARATA
ncbi:signal transduction histidine kinase [Nitrospirillum amazonense]|uniref:histidine kinase n=1 Tax=Nitrospirillum amazonense TaxID=28077 RepID=A0A560F5F4_9PROT|nr:hybrid sensor histidine kinase/response regulator [Nitrospirillum amazonense]TWB16862.1 signal transduction histidine kinase [Nitrospirillum amazonense]